VGARISLGALGDSFGATSGAAGPALRISVVSSVFVESGCTAAFIGAGAGLRTCAAAALTRSTGSLRAITAFFTAGRLAAVLPFAALGAGFLAGIDRSSESMGLMKDGRLYRPDSLSLLVPLLSAQSARKKPEPAH
jgi:hypothetical protein